MTTLNRLLITSLVASLSTLAACSNQSPLHVLKRNGDAAYDRGDYAKAESNYSEYIRRKPDVHQLRHDLAKAYVADGKPKSAISELTIALDVAPLNDDYLDLLAKAMYDAGERDALTTLLRRNASERGRVSDYLRLGEYSSKLGNADEAKEALLTAAKLDGGKNTGPQIALANFYGSVGDKKSQVRRLRMAYFLDPSNKEVVSQLTAMGEQPGPGYGFKPEEYVLTPMATPPAQPKK